ncbi:MAG: cell cycle transcriptional regulator TrcR [Alphaproteobacteria bacterium]
MTAPLMPKATAVWLVENTTLTFRQIAVFCELHELEIQAIADGDVAYNIVGISPVMNGQLSLEEIKRCEADPRTNLEASLLERNVKAKNAKSKKVLSPSQRADKPAAILWVVKNYPQIIDSQICKLIGTTKPTIETIRNGTYRDMNYLRPKNPVAVGLCNEKDLENALTISKTYTEPKAKKVTKKKAAPKKTAAKKVAPKK